MRDFLKRFIIIFLFIFIILFVFEYMRNNVINKQENNTQSVNEAEETIKDEVNISDTDEVEKYDDCKARCTSDLNFRTSPSTEGDIISTIPNNSVIDINSKLRNGWYKISYNNTTGYVSGDYIKILTDEELKEFTTSQEFQNSYALVSVNSSVNLRESANENAKILTSIKAGGIVKVIKQMANGWFYVEGNSIEGYVSGENVKILTQEEYNSYSSNSNNLLNPSEGIIATYTSTSTYNSNSRYNMHLAADYQNGVIINPGETYSHLNVVHPIGEPNKYVSSTIFVGQGKTAQASGGGICQTSSTTYAAIVSSEEKGIKTRTKYYSSSTPFWKSKLCSKKI